MLFAETRRYASESAQCPVAGGVSLVHTPGMNKNIVRSTAAVLVFAAGSAVASAQVEVVFLAEGAVADHPKSLVPGDPDGLGMKFRNFQRSFKSPNGQRWITVATVTGPSTAQDQAIVIGQGLSATVPVVENVTADNEGVLITLGVNVSARVSNDGHWINAVNGWDRVVTGGLTGVPTVVAKGNDSLGAPAGYTWAGTSFSSANLTAIGPSFVSTMSFSPNGTSRMGVIGGVPTLSCPIDVPGNQSNGDAFVMTDIDRDYFWTDSTGTRWLAKGKVGNTNTVLVVNGSVVVQVGAPVGGMSSTVSSISDAFMEPSGDWYARGGAADGLQWAVKNGVIVARAGSPIVPGSSENFASILDVRGNGRGDYVVVGRTNNSDPDKTDVMVVNGRHLIARESDAVDLDGDGRVDPDLYLNIMDNKMMFADDGYLYFANRLKALPTGTVDAGGATNRASLMRVAACPGDLGKAGGLTGADGALDNNDFIAFIGLFFDADARADRGVAGGLPGSDGVHDNNDFIAFINQFFDGC